jgi:hypothetical protein
MLRESLDRIQGFRDQFGEFQAAHQAIMEALPVVLTKLYSDCQVFAESEIRLTINRFNEASNGTL